MKQLRILIVDDDRDFAESMAELVEMNGHKTILAFNGLNAIKLFKQNNIDLILMDIRMPGMNGVETLQEVKKLNPDIPVAMMTGYSDQPLLELAIQNDAIGILDKPININQLKHLIKNAQTINKILILEDDKDFADSLKNILIQAGYEVIISNSVKEAFAHALNHSIDLYLFDLRINGKNGIDLWHMLLKEGINAPVIFSTGFADEYSNQINDIRGKENVQILEKPFEPAKLIKMLQAMG